ncbi:hypothetical protein I79_009398 [Cricetulus griseus]|uniref:Uncharacterized protein n=1 Tax=Cricetulus griseus TaxID=10029 RepID=G3HFN6_CRIGR|nr:hypothetical protein I79_009398 [Cricetulus griseus]
MARRTPHQKAGVIGSGEATDLPSPLLLPIARQAVIVTRGRAPDQRCQLRFRLH